MALTAKQVDDAISALELDQCESLADELQLWGWGRWSREGLERLGASGPGYAFSGKGTWEKDLSRRIPGITDEEGMRIDAAVARLRPHHRQIIKAIYLEWHPWRVLPNLLGIAKGTIIKYQHEALGALDVILRGGDK
jgi:hypothetical protein